LSGRSGLSGLSRKGRRLSRRGSGERRLFSVGIRNGGLFLESSGRDLAEEKEEEGEKDLHMIM
jgi:hypothetical protein